MAVVMESEDGRRCDERCYDAKRLGCRCICGGKNHGLGLLHALDADAAVFGGDEEELDEESSDE